MNNIPLLMPALVGITAGFVYGIQFALQQRYLFAHNHTHSPAKRTVLLALLFLARMTVLAGTIYYLLRLPLLPSILVIAMFVVTFWLVILHTKAHPHGGN